LTGTVGEASVLRDELWAYQVGGMRERVVVLVSAHAVLDHDAYQVLYGVQVSATDPGHVLAVSVLLGDTRAGWTPPPG
jgi:hypothetical protein